MLEAIKSTVLFLNQLTNHFTPEIGIITGTGLSALGKNVLQPFEVPYNSIPDFPVTTVEGHTGNFIFGRLGGKNIVVMQGRFHFYEGYTMQEIIFPIRIMKFLGVHTLMATNASGGLNPLFEIGDLMVITDHINLMPNPLIGKHCDEFGERFPDMSEAYSMKIIHLAQSIAKSNETVLKMGCYAAVTGPTLETKKEYEYLRTIGADAVGMSTAPEIIAAHQMGVKCFAISVITDLGVPGKIQKTTHQDVLHEASRVEGNVTNLFERMIEKL